VQRLALDALGHIGATVIDGVARLGLAALFFVRVIGTSPVVLRRFALVSVEMLSSGVRSILIIVVSGTFVGMVLAVQGYEVLQRFGASESLGVLVALSLVRELGPVVTALLFAGRAGSAIAAEIGLMRATDQIPAMEMMAVDPVARVVGPRFFGAVFSMPLLAAMFSVMGVVGAWLIGVRLIGIDDGSFWSQMQAAVDVRHDVMNGLFKSLVFGVAVGFIAVFEGFHAVPTARGVSAATTRTVVVSSLAVLFLDFIMTAWMFRG
jgi:phospholipid/cholesterol/gamma-HCH transport system permease protein